MPTPTYDLIASNVLGSSASSIEFASISGSYRDLVIVVTATNSSLAQLRVRPNGLTTNLSSVTAEGNGTTTASVNYTNIGEMSLFNNLGTGASIQIIHFMDYAQTDKHKTILMRTNRTPGGTAMIAGRWASTSAITSIVLAPDGGTFSTASSFYLYGLVA
jgi:hypothetical protein